MLEYSLHLNCMQLPRWPFLHQQCSTDTKNRHPRQKKKRKKEKTTVCICASYHLLESLSKPFLVVAYNIASYLILILSPCQDINECNNAPCQNNGTCSNLIDDFSCACPAGYTGRSCATGMSTFKMFTLGPVCFFLSVSRLWKYQICLALNLVIKVVIWLVCCAWFGFLYRQTSWICQTFCRIWFIGFSWKSGATGQF